MGQSNILNISQEITDNSEILKRKQRHLRMKKTVWVSVLAKMCRFSAQLIVVGTTVRYLGPEQYGIWMTVMAGLGWISFGQFGIGPGLINALAEANGSGDRFKEGVYFTSALYIITCVASCLFLSICLLSFATNFNRIIQINVTTSETADMVNYLVIVCAGLFSLRFPLSIFESAYVAYQEGYIARFWDILGQIFSLVALFILIQSRTSLHFFVLGFVLSSEIAVLTGGLLFVIRHRPNLRPKREKFSFEAGKSILNTGAGFFLLQLAGYLLMSGGVLVLAHFHGPTAVTPYSVTWQLCMMAAGIWMMFSDALWGAFGEAKVSQDWHWIKLTTSKLIRYTAMYSFLFSLTLVLVGRPIIAFWSGTSAVPSLIALVWIALFSLAFSWSVLYGQILNALGVVWPQIWSSLLNGIVSVLFSFWLVPTYGLSGLAASLCLSTIITTAWSRPILFNRMMKQYVQKA